MSEISLTSENAEDVNKHVIYAASVIANIRVRLDKYYECYMDDKDLIKIWKAPWLSASGNLHERIKKLAQRMNANVDWPKKGEAHFSRSVPLIEIVSK